MTRKKCMVYFEDGSQAPFDSLRHMVPSRLFLFDDHIQFLDYVVESLGYADEEDRKLLMNLFSQKSTRLKNASALIWLSRHYHVRIRSCTLDNQIAGFVAKFLNNVSVAITRKCFRLIPRSYYITMMVKILCNMFFSLVGRFSCSSNKPLIVKAHVENVLRIFPYDKNISHYLVFPSFRKFKRQLRFLRKLKMENYSYALYGIPYSLLSAFRVLFALGNLKNGYSTLIKVEKLAYTKLAHNLLDKYGAMSSYSSADEFEVAGFICSKAMSRLKSEIRINLTTHGVGVYGPYIYCNSLHVMNRFQALYYEQYSCLTSTQKSPAGKRDYFGKEQVVVFLHQPWTECGCMYESGFQERAISCFIEMSKIFSERFFLRMHPSASERQIRCYMDKLNGTGVQLHRDEHLCQYKNIFINYESAAYYDLSMYGDTIFLKDDSNLPVLFDEQGLGCELGEIKIQLECLLHEHLGMRDLNGCQDLLCT